MTGKVGGLSKVRRDLAEIKRERRARLRDRYLRGVGYVTRPVVYLGPVTLPVWWLWSYRGAFSQSLDSLTAIDLLLIGGCVVGFFGIAIPAMLFLQP